MSFLLQRLQAADEAQQSSAASGGGKPGHPPDPRRSKVVQHFSHNKNTLKGAVTWDFRRMIFIFNQPQPAPWFLSPPCATPAPAVLKNGTLKPYSSQNNLRQPILLLKKKTYTRLQFLHGTQVKTGDCADTAHSIPTSIIVVNQWIQVYKHNSIICTRNEFLSFPLIRYFYFFICSDVHVHVYFPFLMLCSELQNLLFSLQRDWKWNLAILF